ncbi:MAG: aldolase/citrate lyase family protein [Pirellulaceae bacterium]
MRRSKVLDKIQNNQAAFGVCLHLNAPELFEMTSLMGFDAIWMDMEHHFSSLDKASQMMRAARVGGTDIVARPAKGEFMRMSRMLEAGATGIMYPRCSSAEEAAEVVKWAKFAPVGQRGFDGSGPDVPYMMTPMTKYLTEANERTFVIIQIEEPEALAHADAIAAVPGVDMLMLGPADFSILSGIPGQFDHPKILEAVKTVADAAKSAGKRWAATCGSLGQAKQYVEMGASLIFMGCDIVYVMQGLQQLKTDLATEFPESEATPETNGTAKHYQETL